MNLMYSELYNAINFKIFSSFPKETSYQLAVACHGMISLKALRNGTVIQFSIIWREDRMNP